MSEPAPEIPAPGAPARALAWLAVRLRWLVVAAWAAGAVAAFTWLPSLSEAESAPLGGLVPKDAEALAVSERSREHFGVPIQSGLAIVERDPQGLSDEALQHIGERALAIAEGEHPSGAIYALPLVNDPRIVPEAREQGTTVITWLGFPAEIGWTEQVAAAEAMAEASPVDGGGGSAGVTGAVPARLAEFEAIEEGLPLVEIVAVAVIAILLAVTFRSLVAPVLALLAAGVAYVVAVGSVAWMGGALGIGIPQEVEPLMVVILLGIVTDYAIFFLSGTRERLEAGEPRLQAVQTATARVLPIVVTAGLIVAAGTAALLAGQLEFFRAFGPGMALAALVGLAVSITLVPALLAILGRAAFWPHMRHAPTPTAALVARDSERNSLGVRVGRVAASRPAAALIVVVTLGVLVAAASGLRNTNLGFTLVRGLPEDSGPRAAELAAGQGFTAGIVAPTEVLVEGSGVARELEALVRLEEAVDQSDGVAIALGPRETPEDVAEQAVLSPGGDAARFAVVFDEPSVGGNAIDLLESLQAKMPSLQDEAGLADARVSFGGETALAAETVDSTVGDIERIALAALAVNLALLVLFLRSLVAPLFLLVTSVLALAATLGITTYVFQGLLGNDELTYYVPFAAAVLLVSLGSDYNVFVAGQIAEEARSRPLREAIAVAAPRASRAITVAGIALAASFAALALVPSRDFQELAFALAVGVIVDAFVVRSLLVPALIALFGRFSWWPGGRRHYDAVHRGRERPASPHELRP